MADGVELGVGYVTLVPSAKGFVGSLNGQISKPIETAAKTGVTKVESTLGRLKSTVGSVIGNTDKMTVRAGVAGAALAGIGVGIDRVMNQATKAAKDYGSEVVLLQRMTGASARESSTWAAILGRYNVTGQKAALVVKSLTNAIATHSEGLASLGIATQNADGSNRTSMEVLADLAEKYKTAKDKTEVLAVGTKTLGRGFASLLPLLSGGKEGIENLAAAAEKNGLIFSNADIAAVKAYSKALKDNEDATKGVAVQVGLATLPFKTWEAEALGKSLSTLRDLNPELQKAAGAVGVVAGPVAKIGGGILALVAASGLIKQNLADLGSGIAGGFKNLKFWAQTSPGAMQTAGASSVAQASADIFYGSEVWARFQKNVLNAQDSTSKGARTVASAISSCNGVVSTGTRLTVSNTNAVEDLNAAQEQQIRDLHGRMVAQNSLNGSLRTANDAELDYRTAVLDAKSAHKELNDLRKHGKQGTEEYARAEIAAAQADQQKADALNAMREAQHQANVATIAGTTDTANLTAAGQKYAENLNKATDELQKWKSKLDTVPKDKRTEVKAEIKKAQANVDRIKREIAGIKGKTVTLNVKATGGGTVRAVVNGKLTQFVVNASGGIWPARPGGYLSTIAEAGVDEAAIPLRKDSRSRALLAYASNAILGTPAGGNVFNISGSKLDAETIQQAVNRSLVASFGG